MKKKEEAKESLSEKERIFKTIALRSGIENIKSANDLRACFSKVCTNTYAAEDNGKPMLYRREDLSQWAKEAFGRGEKYFYAEPVNPNHPYGRLKLVEPKYEYRLTRTLTPEEFADVFGKES